MNARTLDGWTPLQIATGLGIAGVASLLKERGATGPERHPGGKGGKGGKGEEG